ncbi:MAG: tetratricopeptide repeat protein [Burkholderiales bacterium]|nr:tetratricopeptide repeat protein [Burkholderiales bacterium]
MTSAPDSLTNSGEDPVYLNAQQITELAAKYMAEGKHEDVEKLCAKLLAWREDHGQAWFFRALVAHAEGRFQDAIDFLAKTTNATDIVVQRLLLEGRCRAALGDMDVALAAFRRALDFQPDNAEGYYWVGMCLKEKQDMTDARSFLRRATLLDPKLAPAWYEQGNVALLVERYDEAIRAYQKAVELIPNAHEVQNNLGLAFQAKGDIESAEKAFSAAIALNANYAEAYGNLSLMLRSAGRTAEADKFRDKAVELQPALADVLAAS